MNKKTRQHLRENPLAWVPNLHKEALDYIDSLEAQLAQRGEQPDPRLTECSEPVVSWLLPRLPEEMQELVVARRDIGIEKYGMELHTHNGRDALEDARQELGDLLVYLAQAEMEGHGEAVEELRATLKKLF